MNAVQVAEVKNRADQFIQELLQDHLKVLQQIHNRQHSPENYVEEMSKTVELLCAHSRSFAENCHRLKFFFDWAVPPIPEWMDHFVDQYVQFREGKTLWTERGVYNVAGLKPGGNYLELCSGDGFNTFHYYRPFARSITAVDFDETALRHAREYNDAENIEFRKADIRTEFPVGQYDNILWDAAIEHFTEDEIASIMGNIKASLKPGGTLSGYTLVEPEDGGKHLHHHEREFHSKEDLAEFLTPYFKEVRVFETIHPERHNLYFYAGESTLPFDDDWCHALRVSAENHS